MKRPKLPKLGFASARYLGIGWLILLCVTPARAHTGGTLSYSQWTLEAQQQVAIFRVKTADFRSIPAPRIAAGLPHFLQQNTQLLSGEEPCRADTSSVLLPQDGWTRIRLEFHCGGEPDTVQMSWMEPLPGHLHMLTRDGTVHLLRASSPHLRWQQGTETWENTLQNQWRHGVLHIAAGWDHLAFLLGLLLLARSLLGLATMITGFSIGHTLALLLATLQGVLPPSVTVEMAIAASIVFVGLPRHSGPARWGSVGMIGLACAIIMMLVPNDPLLWSGLLCLGLAHYSMPQHSAAIANLALASVFGLLHGFGFASAILEDVAQASTLWPVLLGFNLGVESGQLLFVLPVWGLLLALNQRFPRQLAPSTEVIRACVLGIGGFALASRLLAAA